MKVLSLWQPWASAMAIGLKTIETRHWSTNYRGPLAIHAALRWTREEQLWGAYMAALHGEQVLADPPRGVIVAVGVLVDIERTEDLVPGSDLELPRLTETEEMWGNYGSKRFGWIFKNLIALHEPIPMRGKQGLWNWPTAADVIGNRL